MRRLMLAAVAAAFAFALMVGSASADEHLQVQGKGEFGPPFTSNLNGDNFFDIKVRSNEDGSDVSGKIRVYDPYANQFYEATPICLRVSGNSASILGVITSASSGNARAGGVWIGVTDNDHPKGPDLFHNFLYTSGQFAATFGGQCPVPAAIGVTVNKGHIQVPHGDPEPDA